MQPARSLLFVPGDDEDRLDAAMRSDADGLILDLEDTVGPTAKEAARASTVETVGGWADERTRCVVRINGLDTPHGLDDVEAFVRADTAPDAFLVPDVRDGTELEIVADALAEASFDASLVALLERPGAVLDAHRIARSTSRLSALAFGSIDFQTNMGMSVLDPDTDVYPPRYLVAMAASAAGLEAFDTVVLDTGDDTRLREEARTARMLGYDGKAAVTPDQTAVINEVFTPSEEEVARATRLVEAFEAAGDDTGLIEFEGTFVDKPVVDQQRALLARARAVDRDAE
ncbi:HpcH/HpaI aldolase/citrate lyase family protein [Halomarina halobia]|uniref:HpcH/HpaI aldolase/citrate lyase family protein n=1 Tax=Halomarina halobia TaxID=3033386 RepID=A0ABD6ADP6_9EURY|nr:CoA ester lyase [Halomarina sp. PSR21]